MQNFDECTCECHNSRETIYHCMPCCTKCKYCHKNILSFNYDEHIEKCKKNYTKCNCMINEKCDYCKGLSNPFSEFDRWDNFASGLTEISDNKNKL
ncbi:hypothetical protein [Aliarcobacter butzleri]|uniref:hypothetical protein n=1 Tax=Aliarcobacter butzleri TaxID=28197 RepID=UPI001269E6FB|nr:hypothetical protein [Aliarcobacter butzleri]